MISSPDEAGKLYRHGNSGNQSDDAACEEQRYAPRKMVRRKSCEVVDDFYDGGKHRRQQKGRQAPRRNGFERGDDASGHASCLRDSPQKRGYRDQKKRDDDVSDHSLFLIQRQLQKYDFIGNLPPMHYFTILTAFFPT
ncbi:hypothetical protein SDC9_158887 [bioreactor metagenome]|uniref:Uncharacterized protein n=1 Tax=bioreactor metagenome TaxID=1076179 RepID=A0A645FGG5_9ZZZZ